MYIRILALFLFLIQLPAIASSKIENSIASDLICDGTKESPYTTSNVIALNPTSTTEAPAGGAGVWVKGYIVGYMPSSSKTTLDNTVFAATADLKTNIVLGPTADCKDYTQCISIQLPSGAVRTALNLQDNPGNLGAAVVLYGDVMRYSGGPGLKNTSKYELVEGGGGDTPTPSGDTIYEGLVANCDGWTFDNINMPDVASYIWSWKGFNGSGYLNASCFIAGTAYVSEAIAYTTVDLTGKSEAELTFDHAAKFQTTLKDFCGLVVREAGASSWTSLSIPTWPEAGSWTFVNSGAISLKAYAGKKIEIGLKYGSSESGSDTWEIKNFIIKGMNISDYNSLFYKQMSPSEVWVAYNGDGLYSGDIIIPEKATIAGITYTVTGIEPYAFRNCRTLSSIYIPNTINTIGESAFSGCSSLTSINIPASVNSIGEFAFSDCSSLTSIILPETLSKIENRAFSYCTSLSAINIPASVNSIGESAFSNCTNLADVTIANGNTDLNFSHYNTFNNCKIENLHIGRALSGDTTQFYGMTSLKKVTFGNSITFISPNIFRYCSNLSSVELPASIISIGNNAFYFCESLISIELPSSITSIGNEAFANSGLVSINIPEAVSNIGRNAFNCARLRTVFANAKVPAVLTAQPFLIDKYSTLYVSEDRDRVYSRADYWKDFPNIIEYNKDDEIVYSKDGLYYAPYTEDKAFVQAGSCLPAGEVMPLDKITLNGKVYTVDAIPSRAFMDCTDITTVTIPANINTIGSNAFRGCSKLTDVIIADTDNTLILTTDSNNLCNQFAQCPIANLHYGRNLIGTAMFSGNDNIVNLTIGEMVTEIASSAFQDCSSIVNVSLPESVTSIGAKAFSDCNSVKTVRLSRNLTYIGNYAFSGCTNLPAVYIPASVTNIGSRVFYNCTALRAIYSPTSTPSLLGDNVFGGVDKYNCILYVPIDTYDIYLEADQWKDFIDTQEVLFWNNEGLSFIGRNGKNATATVIACESSVTDVTLNEKVVPITPKNTTQHAIATEYTINSIATGAFSNCFALAHLRVNSSRMLECEGEPFNDFVYENCELIVPDSLYHEFNTAEFWKKFNIIKMESAGIYEINTDNVINSITIRNGIITANINCNIMVFTIDGQTVANCDLATGENLILTSGFYVLSINNKQIKIAIR